MRFYQATRFLFPRSYQLRMFSICFGAVHLPIVVFCTAELASGRWHWPVFLSLLAATLAGTGAAIAAMSALLAPIGHATSLLRSLQQGERIPPVPTGGDDLVGALLKGVAQASMETEIRIEKLAKAAGRDMLTGLRNRRGFMETIAPLLRSDRNSIVAMIDLDHFKTVNDSFGHDEGDRVLTAFSRRLEDGLRQSDIAGRWGGEEFAVLLPGTNLDEATQIVERLREALKTDPIGQPGSEPLTFSCGLAAVRDLPALGAAMRKADAALYGAKRRGRNRVENLV